MDGEQGGGATRPFLPLSKTWWTAPPPQTHAHPFLPQMKPKPMQPMAAEVAQLVDCVPGMLCLSLRTTQTRSGGTHLQGRNGGIERIRSSRLHSKFNANLKEPNHGGCGGLLSLLTIGVPQRLKTMRGTLARHPTSEAVSCQPGSPTSYTPSA